MLGRGSWHRWGWRRQPSLARPDKRLPLTGAPWATLPDTGVTRRDDIAGAHGSFFEGRCLGLRPRRLTWANPHRADPSGSRAFSTSPCWFSPRWHSEHLAAARRWTKGPVTAVSWAGCSPERCHAPGSRLFVWPGLHAPPPPSDARPCPYQSAVRHGAGYQPRRPHHRATTQRLPRRVRRHRSRCRKRRPDIGTSALGCSGGAWHPTLGPASSRLPGWQGATQEGIT